MSGRIDFPAVAEADLWHAPMLLQRWFPRGKLLGHEFEIGNIKGEAGASLRVNVRTGISCDFADDAQRGTDLISLRATTTDMSQADAGRDIARELGMHATRPAPRAPRTTGCPSCRRQIAALRPSPLVHRDFGTSDHVFQYRTSIGALAFCVCCWDKTAEWRKQVLPSSWGGGKLHGRLGWHWKAWPEGRPTYRLKNSYSEAHLRQAMTSQAHTMILDEADRDDTTGPRILAAIELIRKSK